MSDLAIGFIIGVGTFILLNLIGLSFIYYKLLKNNKF